MVAENTYYDAQSALMIGYVKSFLTYLLAMCEEAQPPSIYSGWREVSEIKGKYGYNVQSSLSIDERRKALSNAVGKMGLWKVANHIAAFISLQAKNDAMCDAVGSWKADLTWLRAKRFRGQFQWPDHRDISIKER